MLDRPDQVERLLAAMTAALPLAVTCQPALVKSLRARDGFGDIAPRCVVTRINYMGDDGGIVCGLDFGLGEGHAAAVVSLTHLSIDPSHPLAREIASYQYHRLKQLRAQSRGAS